MARCPYCDMHIKSLKSTHIDVCANVPPPRMLARIYRHGVSVHRIARFYGVSHQFIHNQLKRTGFKDVKRMGRAPMPEWAPGNEAPRSTGRACSRCEVMEGEYTHIADAGNVTKVEVTLSDGMCQWCQAETAAPEPDTAPTLDDLYAPYREALREVQYA